MNTKTILITGASSGLGKATANYLYSLGYNVLGTSRNPKKYEKEIKFPLLTLDISQEKSINELIKKLKEHTKKIDILINNAGVGITGPVEETNIKKIKEHFDTNFFGQLFLIQKILPIMRNQKYGKIINITSIAGYMGIPFRGIYAAAKSSFIIVSEALRLEIASFGIQLTTIAPGDYATNISTRRYHSPIIKNSPYHKKYKQNLNTIIKDVNSGNKPIEVAHKIAKLIKKRKLKPHYSVGPFIQRFSLTFKRILPSIFYEKILKKYYNL